MAFDAVAFYVTGATPPARHRFKLHQSTRDWTRRMITGSHTAEEWRRRADEARAKADAMRDWQAKQAMLQVAAICEEMAALAARRDARSN